MRILVASLVTLLAAAPCMAQGIGVSSPLNRHNLSTTGPGPVKSATVTEICVFCHAPHNARPATPLWNQAVSGQTYASYSSSTLTARPGQPTGSSKLCLSCHDGTVALGKTMTRGSLALTGTEEGRIPAASPSVLGTNLSNDHPVSFIPVTGPQIVVPAANDPVQTRRRRPGPVHQLPRSPPAGPRSHHQEVPGEVEPGIRVVRVVPSSRPTGPPIPAHTGRRSRRTTRPSAPTRATRPSPTTAARAATSRTRPPGRSGC